MSFKTIEAVEVMGCLIPAFTEGGHIREIESDDIILNSFPVLGKVYSQSKTIDEKHKNLLIDILGMEGETGGAYIEKKCAEGKNHPFDFARLAADIISEYPDKRSEIIRIAESHKQETRAHDNALYHQEIGRKNSLCQDQLDEPKKLAWNMENTAASLSGLIQESRAENQDAAAQLQVAKLSYLISLTGWGINHANYQSEIGSFTKQVTSEVYQKEINKKSYSRAGSNVREKVGWANISQQQAENRLKLYQESFQELNDFALSHGAYFEKMDQYQQAVRTGDMEAKKKAQSQLQQEFAKIISTMPELQEMVGAKDASAKRGQLSGQLTSVAMSTAELNEVREFAAQRREKARLANQNVAHSTAHSVSSSDVPNLIYVSHTAVAGANNPAGIPVFKKIHRANNTVGV